MFTPIKEHNPFEGIDPTGIQKIYRFENGYGASVVRHPFSYGNAAGLWELAVIKFKDSDDPNRWELDYDTPVTDDVLGRLDDEAVTLTLMKIEKLSNAQA